MNTNLLNDKVVFQKVSKPKKSPLLYALTILLFATILVAAGRSFAASNVEQAGVEASQVSPTIKDEIIADHQNRLSADFKIPENLKKRVGFWFDIYSKYSASEHVIHHVDYPWIVFSIYNEKAIADAAGNRWTKYHKTRAAVSLEKKRVQRMLLKLAKKKNYANLSEEEQKYFDLMKDVPGSRPKVFKHAAYNIRGQLGQKDFMLSGLHTSGKYLPTMEKTFAEKGLPTEITRLPLVESSFNEAAVSKVGASGIWQLMPKIGRHFLYVDSVIDERNSPLKATEAAAKLLKQNLQILKKWPLALTAYNHGPGGIIKASKKVKSDDIGVIIENYSSRSFGFASSNFYCSFLAALHVEKYQKEVFGEIPRHEHLQLTASPVRKSLPMKKIAEAAGLAWEDFLKLNLDIRKQAISKNRKLPSGFRLLLPAENAQKLEAYYDSLPTSISQRATKASEKKL